MKNQHHTFDNIHILEPQNPTLKPVSSIAINCNSNAAQKLEELVSVSLSENTKRAYLADLAHFVEAGGNLQAMPEAVALYVSTFAETLAVSTLTRRLATLSKIHKANDWPNPCHSDIVRSAMKGMKRLHGGGQQQAKPLTRETLLVLSSPHSPSSTILIFSSLE